MSQSAKAEGIYIVRIGSRLANQMCYTSISFETEYALVLAILAIYGAGYMLLPHEE
jgi:hypothetical protein